MLKVRLRPTAALACGKRFDKCGRRGATAIFGNEDLKAGIGSGNSSVYMAEASQK
jgi:hypothetical protein